MAHNIKKLEWLANSSDFKPIGNARKAMKGAVQKKQKQNPLPINTEAKK